MVMNKGFETNAHRWAGKAKFAQQRAATVLRPRPINENQSGSGSDMDICSDSEFSPQDHKGFFSKSQFSSQNKPSDNGSLKVKKVFGEDEWSDSATSTEISFTQTSEGYCSSRVASKFSHDTLSAPPLVDSGSEMSQSVDQIPILGGHHKPYQADVDLEVDGFKVSKPVRLPAFQARLASEQGTWCAVVSYDACVRLCLHVWALRGSSEVHCFLENECALLRDAFGLRHVLLQSEDELLEKRSTELVSQGAAQKTRKTSGKIKLQVRKVKIGLEPPPSCFVLSTLKSSIVENESLQRRYLNVKSILSSTCKSIKRVHVAPQVPANASLSNRSLAYLHASTKYMKQVSAVLKIGATNLCSSSLSYDHQVVQETYSCLLKMKSSPDEDSVRLRPGSGEDYVFFPDGLADNLIVEVRDSKGCYYGRTLVQVAAIADSLEDKLKWWPIYSDPEHEPVGRVQLYINYTTTLGESNHPKCGSVAETMAYDFLLEVALKVQQFHQRNLLLKDPWRWLVIEFASYYGVSDAYTKLRYLSHIMDVATPTEYCLNLVYDLMSHVLMKENSRSTLSHQEKRILADIEDQVKDILALVFENYKSLDESSPSGMMDVFGPASGLVAPALAPAIKLYTLMHDILSPEAQLKFCRYFQAATKKRLRRHLTETDEFTQSNSERTPMDLPMSYGKMKSLILNIRNEVFTDMKIHNQHVLPSFIELPNISSSIYSVELGSRLHGFLVACPPPAPSPPVSELVIAAADFQRDLSLWNVNPVNGGVDAKKLFDPHINLWIQDKRHDLLDFCKQDKVKACGVGTQNSTTPFIDEMFVRLEATINEYQIILCRWPEYISLLENAIADVEKATVEAVEKQFGDVLLPLKDNLTNKIFGLKYVQRLSKGTVNTYLVPDELGIFLNSMRRLLDVLCPKIDSQMKSWSSCIPDDGRAVIGEHLNDVKVMLRSKFRSYGQAIVEKLADNTKVQSSTKLKNIIRDSKEAESDVQSRMQPLRDLLIKTIHHLDSVVEPTVFVQICKEFWERMGQDMLHLLEDGREKGSWYKGLRVAVSILDDIFASEMQKLRGNSLQRKDLEPPGSIREIHSMLCKDAHY
ncbi:uncharacterized protein LOC21391910 [Morus notabilis]|uniref:uncharacterized protein LOC21391910 n=1 Tax=Morus notabilis TaxID=981085 RepID=UPI000CECEE37|nr:uncharacterized protein LOC21391910 [Morus notabilis]